MNIKYEIVDFIQALCIVAVFVFVSMIITYNSQQTQPTIEYKEVYNLRCSNVNAIGCTTAYPGNHYLIEYVPDSQRCHKEGCISINDTIKHELNHVNQDIKYGYMWEEY